MLAFRKVELSSWQRRIRNGSQLFGYCQCTLSFGLASRILEQGAKRIRFDSGIFRSASSS
jgi:hypothetical protein